MQVSQPAPQPSWWSQTFAAGERDVKEDVLSLKASESEAVNDNGWGEDGFGFDDLLDIVNPLQHLPFISTAYREFTGDTISPAARMIGGGIYGGPVGLVAAAANNFVEAETGGDIGATMVAALTGEGSSDTATTVAGNAGAQLAEAPREFALHEAPAANTDPVPALAAAARDARSPINPQAVAAYAKASALTTPTPGSSSVDWTGGTIRNNELTGGNQPQSVPAGGLDALIRQSQAKVATRRSGMPLPPRMMPPSALKAAGVQTGAEPAQPTMPVAQAGLADWMMKALDKYDSLKAETPAKG